MRSIVLSVTGLKRTSKRDEDQYLFRVPSLLNVAMTAPYTHTGSIRTLEAMVRFMGKEALRTTLADDEVGQLVAFLRSLTGRLPAVTPPVLPVAAHE